MYMHKDSKSGLVIAQDQGVRCNAGLGVPLLLKQRHTSGMHVTQCTSGMHVCGQKVGGSFRA